LGRAAVGRRGTVAGPSSSLVSVRRSALRAVAVNGGARFGGIVRFACEFRLAAGRAASRRRSETRRLVEPEAH